ncbi:MAG: MFS transporter [Acidobacteriota bacterium]|nr:MFS transporter [Acidobacteriota bacterium]MDQ5870835.1 MFS transporter [Acidobacteriota bacterium]
MFLLGLGENLWKAFIPKYLERLGAPVLAIGLYGTLRDFLDGAYQYPGGWIADRYGRRRALLLFVGLASVGYLVYFLAPSWPYVLVGLVFSMAWAGMASPTLFAVVGDALPRGRRAIGFTVQSILKRLPIIVAPTLGGLAIASGGVENGVRLTLLVTIVLALVTLGVVARVRIPIVREEIPTRIGGVWRSLPSPLKWLLFSDVFVRTCEGLVDVFLVIYVINEMNLSAPQFGALIAIQSATAILVYIPASKIADRAGRKPFVIATFLCFAAFPLAVIHAYTFFQFALAFVVGGLREVGEPARKAMIVDLSRPDLRARSIGLYYLVRSVAIAPAAFVGALLWRVGPSVPFYAAAAVGLVGTVIFTLTVKEEHAA